MIEKRLSTIGKNFLTIILSVFVIFFIGRHLACSYFHIENACNSALQYSDSEKQYLKNIMDIWLPEEIDIMKCGYTSMDEMMMQQLIAGQYVNVAMMETFNNSYLKIKFSGDFYNVFMCENKEKLGALSYAEMAKRYVVVNSKNIQSIIIAKNSTSLNENSTGYEIQLTITTNSWAIKNFLRYKTWKTTFGIQ